LAAADEAVFAEAVSSSGERVAPGRVGETATEIAADINSGPVLNRRREDVAEQTQTALPAAKATPPINERKVISTSRLAPACSPLKTRLKEKSPTTELRFRPVARGNEPQFFG
jgi:hypothetical protein